MKGTTKTKKVERNKNQQTPNQASHSHDAISNVPTREEIEQRAYEIYLARGGADGNDQDDWLQAEGELCEARDQRSRHPELGGEDA